LPTPARTINTPTPIATSAGIRTGSVIRIALSSHYGIS
jgi:hypothetical protein